MNKFILGRKNPVKKIQNPKNQKPKSKKGKFGAVNILSKANLPFGHFYYIYLIARRKTK